MRERERERIIQRREIGVNRRERALYALSLSRISNARNERALMNYAGGETHIHRVERERVLLETGALILTVFCLDSI